jgi:hypothetical protein
MAAMEGGIVSIASLVSMAGLVDGITETMPTRMVQNGTKCRFYLDMDKNRGWGALSAEDWVKGILPGTVNKQARRAGEPLAGAGHEPSNQERGSL